MARTPGSEGSGGVIIDQVLCVFSGGDSGAGGGGWWVVAVVMSAEALSLVLEAPVTQDGYHHDDADDQEYSNGHLHRAWGRRGRTRGYQALPGYDTYPTLPRVPSQIDAKCGNTWVSNSHPQHISS